MMFGSPSSFALESTLRLPPDHFLHGTLWIWAGGERMGDGLETSLTIPAGHLGSALGFRERRADETLMRMTKEEVVRFLTSIRYGPDDDAGSEAAQARRQAYEGFIICAYAAYPPFDDVFAALVGASAGERFIWQLRGSSDVHEVLLARGEFDAAVRGFLDWLETEAGWKLEERDWLELSEAEREEVREAVRRREPSLARPVKRAQLEMEAAREWVRRKHDTPAPSRT
jgi:hypothetical protein